MFILYSGSNGHREVLYVCAKRPIRFIGCWLADPLNYYFGRRGAIFFSAHFCLWPVLASAFCQTWPQLFVCRLLLGLGMGAKASTVPVFAAENSPAVIRGALVMTWRECLPSLALYLRTSH